ncbi:hypothetical protein IF690_17085 [Pseudomonas sp. SK3(2021)]|uniref:hypothetical protein n=1 Tax=Pseudomonas sp. SK3(2021) TaxID=2841064 RepID=UPI00192CDF5E|nr:hypothetical protein [Pseudomonas sp. SK3(2021)]QQZ39767.1 hypothetical protein IF690_17085 [Pseudomonas sp. SK3(2021)]
MTTKCTNWHAWLNAMPPKPDELHVVGDVEVANPGVEAYLTMRTPQGINPTILLLDLHLVQRPGQWIQQLSCAQVRFTRVMPPNSPRYTAIEIFYNGERIKFIEDIPVIS